MTPCCTNNKDKLSPLSSHHLSKETRWAYANGGTQYLGNTRYYLLKNPDSLM